MPATFDQLLLTFNFLQTHAMATATPFTMILNNRRLEVLPVGFYLYDDENTRINTLPEAPELPSMPVVSAPALPCLPAGPPAPPAPGGPSRVFWVVGPSTMSVEPDARTPTEIPPVPPAPPDPPEPFPPEAPAA